MDHHAFGSFFGHAVYTASPIQNALAVEVYESPRIPASSAERQPDRHLHVQLKILRVFDANSVFFSQ
jgi:hypothetical protein